MIKINLANSINVALRCKAPSELRFTPLTNTLDFSALNLFMVFIFVIASLSQNKASAAEFPPKNLWYDSMTGGCLPIGQSIRHQAADPKVVADKTCQLLRIYQFECNGPNTSGFSEPSSNSSLSIHPYFPNTLLYNFQCVNSPVIWSVLLDVSTDSTLKDRGKKCSLSLTSNPVNIGNGNKYYEEDIYSPNYSGLKFSSFYNSETDFDLKSFGFAWRSIFDNKIFTDLYSQTNLINVSRQDGAIYTLKKVNGAWLPSSDQTYSVNQINNAQGALVGWTYNDEVTGDIETYNASGKLQSIQDSSGNTQTMSYSTASTPVSIALAPNLLIQVTNQLGQSLRFTYDASSRIKTMTNPAGGVYTYAYDTNNNLTSVTYPDGKVKSYLYGSTAGESGNVSSTPEAGVVYTNSLTGIIDENGDRYATYIYDSKGRATSEYLAGNADAASLVFNTDGSGNPTTTQVTDSRGNVNTYNFTTILGVVKSTGQSQPAGSGCAASASAITYDANGNVASRTDFNGNMTTFSYDMARNLETRRTEGLNTAGNATPATRTITTTWHPTWRLPLVTSEFSGATATGTALRRTTNVYDAKGNITSIAEADPVRSLTRTTTITYTYSSLVPGLVISKVVNGPRTDATDTTTYNYYDANATCTPSSAAPLIDPITNTSPPNLGCRGQLQSMTNALGQTTTYDRYNHHGQVEQMTDANSLVTTSTYDLRQRLLSRTVGTQTTSLTYDNAGQVIQLTMPDNSQLNYTYDAAHRLTEVQDTLGNKVTYTLDTEGNRINEVTTDPLGNLAKTITRSYDALNRLQQVTGME